MKHDDENNMSRTDKTGPFPHTEVETTRPDVDVDKLSDDLLNWLGHGNLSNLKNGVGYLGDIGSTTIR